MRCTDITIVVVTSGPSSVWPRKAYRNPVEQLVSFLDRKHGEDWAIFEFRAEGTGYPDSEVYNRIHHFPWPDHHPPPFAIIPNIMAAMRNWIQRLDGGKKENKRVAVVHCKAGKGRSGTVTCSYLISEEGWKKDEALERFTLRRMRQGFGNGVSIPSQLRWVGYVDRWTNSMQKRYVERPVQILEVHVWGLRDGVKIAVEGFEEQGKRIHNYHTFHREEKTVIEFTNNQIKNVVKGSQDSKKNSEFISTPQSGTPQTSTTDVSQETDGIAHAVLLKPKAPIILPTSDVNIDFERRNKASYTGFTMVTSIAHVWFNAYFEGGYEGHNSGVFEINWDAMDGIKGSSRKGTRALDKLKVVWKYAEKAGKQPAQIIREPTHGEHVPEGKAANWKGEATVPEDEAEAKHSDGISSGRPGATALTIGAVINQGFESLGKELGLRKSLPESANVSKASSMKDEHMASGKTDHLTHAEEEEEGVKSYGQNGEEVVDDDENQQEEEGKKDNKIGQALEGGLGKAANVIQRLKSVSEKDKDKVSNDTEESQSQS